MKTLWHWTSPYFEGPDTKEEKLDRIRLDLQQTRNCMIDSLPLQAPPSNCRFLVAYPRCHHLHQHCTASSCNQLTRKEKQRRRQLEYPYLLVNIWNAEFKRVQWFRFESVAIISNMSQCRLLTKGHLRKIISFVKMLHTEISLLPLRKTTCLQLNKLFTFVSFATAAFQ